MEFAHNDCTGKVFDIQRWSLHDGPGIRTVVFLKGCPLRCAWCSNPESLDAYNELAFFRDKCIACFRCVKNCPNGAITVVDNLPSIDRTICMRTCYAEGLDEFPCTRECYSQALRPVAKVMSVEAVMKEVMKDELIYRQSDNGGVTLSGGEPLRQIDFSYAILRAAKEAGISTAIETSGFASWNSLQKVLPHIDYFYLDIKAFDSNLHEDLVGVPNETILANAPKISKFIEENGKVLTVRVPIIPNHTLYEDFKKILGFLHEKMAPSTLVELMPYHRLGRSKYSNVGRSYDLFELEPLTETELAPYRNAIEGFGFETP